MTDTIQHALSEIQRKLNAPKNQRNDFGKYNYRKAEDIIAAFKELQGGNETLTLTDDVVAVGEKIFLKATATYTAGGESVSVCGWAMHAMSKKGMDEAQITGSCSSYARKYALCGLFAIDDSEHDPDGKDNRHSEPEPPKADDTAVQVCLEQVKSFTDTNSLRNWYVDLKKNAPEVAADKRVLDATNAKKKELE